LTSPAINSGVWHHIVATADGTTFTLYINGSQVAQGTRTRTESNATESFTIGGPAEGNVYILNGSMDDVRVYSRAISAAEVRSLYEGSPHGGGTFTMSVGEVLAGDLTVENGVLDVSDQTFTIQGNTNITGGVMKTGTGAVTFGSDGADNITMNGGILAIESGNIAVDLTINGAFVPTVGTVAFTGSSVTTVIPASFTYPDLVIKSPGSTYTQGGTLDINGSLTIAAGTLDADAANNYDIYLAGNWHLNPSASFVPRQSSLVLDGTSQFILGSSTFYNFTKADNNNDSSGESLFFDNTAVQTVTNQLTFTGLDSDDRVVLRSDRDSYQWDISAPVSQNVDSVDAKDSVASYGEPISATDSVDSGNNIEWGFGYTDLSATAYATDGVTPIMGTSRTIGLRISGGTELTDETDPFDGTFSFSLAPAVPNDQLMIYFKDETEKGNTVTVVDAMTNITFFKLIDDRLIIRSDNGATPTTIADLAVWDNDNDASNMVFTANAGALSVEAGNSLQIDSGNSFTPGGNVNVGLNGAVNIFGTWDVTGTETLTLNGSWDTTGGAFNAGNGTVNFTATDTGTQNTTIRGSTTFYNLTFSGYNGYGGSATLIDDLIVQNDLTISRRNGSYLTAAVPRTITVLNDVTHSGTTSLNKNVTIKMDGPGPQTLTNSGNGKFGSLNVANTMGTVDLGSRILIGGSITIGPGAVLDATANDHSITVNGLWTNNGLFLPNESTVNIAMLDNSDPYGIAGSAVTAFNDLIFSGSSGHATSVNISQDVNVQRDLTVAVNKNIYSNATEAHTISVGRNFTHSSTAVMESDLTLVLNGTGTQTFSTTGTGMLGSLRVSNSSVPVTLSSNLIMGTGTIMIDTGATVDLGTYNVSRTGATAFTNNGTIRLTGDQIFTNAIPDNNPGSNVEYSAVSGTRALQAWDYDNLTINGPESGLAGWWKFDEVVEDTCAGGEDACDSSGNGNHGSWMSGAGSLPDTAPLKFNNHRALDLVPATSDHVLITSSTPAELDLTTDFTLSLWFKQDTSTTTMTLFSTGLLNNNKGFQIQNLGGSDNINIQRNRAGGNEQIRTGNSIYSDGTWNHLLVTVSGTSVKVFLNGVDQALTGSWTENINSYLGTTFRIGIRQDGIQGFDGRIDDVRVYNRVLTAAEIIALYDGYKNPGGMFTISAGENISGDLTIEAGILDINDQALTVSGGETALIDGVIKTGMGVVDFGNVTITNGAFVLESDSDSDLTTGAWTNNGGAVIYADAGANPHALRSAFSPYQDIIIAANANATYTFDSDITVNGDFAINSGRADTSVNNYALTINNSGSFFNRQGNFRARGSVITVPGDWFMAYPGASFTHDTSTVKMTGTGYVDHGHGWLYYFYNVEMAFPGKTTTLTGSMGQVPVMNNITLKGGAFSAGTALSLYGSNPYPLTIEQGTSFTSGSGLRFHNTPAGTIHIPSYDYRPASITFYGGNAAGTTFLMDPGGMDVSYLRFNNPGNPQIFDLNGQAVNITGSLNLGDWNNGISILNAGSGTITIGGNLNIGEGGSSTASRNTFDAGQASITINGNVSLGSGLLTQNTFDLGGSTITLKGNWLGRPNTVVIPGESTVTFASAGNRAITSAGQSFNNLNLASPVASTYTIQDAMDINGDLKINPGNILDAKSGGNYHITIGGNWTNQGSFTARSGTVTFDGIAGQNIISGISAYNDIVVTNPGTVSFIDPFTTVNFTNETAGSSMKFAKGEVYTFSGSLTLTGAPGNEITVNTDDGAAANFIFERPSTKATVWYLDANRADAAANNVVCVDCIDGTTNNSGQAGADAEWVFSTAIDVSGVAYANDETTPLTGASYNVAARVNGVDLWTTTTNSADGTWQFTKLIVNEGDIITIYFYGANDSTAGTYTGNVVIKSDMEDISGLKLIDDHVVLLSSLAGTAINIADVIIYDNDQNAANMLFDAELGTPNTLSVESNNELYINEGGAGFTPGGVVTANGGLKNAGTFTGGAEQLTVNGYFQITGGVFTAPSSTMTLNLPNAGPAYIHTGSGTFENNNGHVIIKGGHSGLDFNVSETFHDVTFNSVWGRNLGIANGDTMIVNGTLRLTDGIINTGTINAKGPIIVDATSDYGGGIIIIDGSDQQSFSLPENAGIPGITLNQSSTSITFATSGLNSVGAVNLQSGTITAQSGDLRINGSLNISGGVFTCSSNTTTLHMHNAADGFNHVTGGVFDHNNGTFVFAGGHSNANFDVTETFNNVTINSGLGRVIGVATGDTMIVNGTLRLTDGSVTNGTIQAKSTIIVDPTSDAGSGVLLIDSAGDQSFTVPAGAGMPGITLNQPATTITMADSGTNTTGAITLEAGNITGRQGNWTINTWLVISGGVFTASSNTTTLNMFNGTEGFYHVDGGTFNPNNGTFIFRGGHSSANFNVTETFNNVTINSGTSYNIGIAPGDTMIVLGLLNLTDGYSNNGTFETHGNVNVNTGFDGGNSPLVFAGTNNQVFTRAGGTILTGDITINKPEGEVRLGSNITLSTAGQDMTITSGTIDLGSYDLVVNGIFTNNGTVKLTGDNTNVTAPVNAAGSFVEYNAGSGSRNVKDWDYQNLKINGPESGLIGWWRFDETAGNTSYDSSTSGYNGAWNGSPMASAITAPVIFKNPHSISFNGSSSYISTRDISFTNAQPFSFSLWVNPAGLTERRTILGKNQYEFFLGTSYSDADDINFTYWNTTGSNELSLTSNSNVLSVGSWTHIAVTYDGNSNGYLYINGVQTASDTTVSAAFPDRTDALTIGRGYAPASGITYFNGTVDDVRVYNRALSAAEVLALADGAPHGGGTFSLGTPETVAADLFIENSILDAGTYALTVDGNTYLNGGVLKTGTGIITFGTDAADNIVLNGGVLSVDSDELPGDLIFNGTWVPNEGTVAFTGNSVSTVVPNSFSYPDLVIKAVSSTYTLAGNLDVNGSLTIAAGTLDGDNINNYDIYLSGDWHFNEGANFIPRQGVVNFDGTSQNVLGNTTFSNLTKADFNDNAADEILYFDNTSTQTVTNQLVLSGLDADDMVVLRSDITGRQWDLKAENTYIVDYVDVRDSVASQGNVINTVNSVDSGNNIDWGFGTTDLLGIAYSNDRVTPLTGTSRSVGMRINGGATEYTDTTDPFDGSFSFSLTPAVGGDIITVYFRGVAEDGNTITKANGTTSLTYFKLIDDHVVIRSDDPPDPLTIADLAVWDNDNDAANMVFTANGGALVLESGNTIYIETGHTFVPGGNVTTSGAGGVIINGTWITTGTESLTNRGDWIMTGTFDPANGTVILDASAGPRTYTGATTFYDLTFSGNPNYNQSVSDDLIVQSDLIINRGADSTRILADGTEVHTISVAGNVLHSGTTGVEGDLTILLNGAGPQTVSNPGSGAIGSLRIVNTASPVTLSSDLKMNGSLTIDIDTEFDVTAGNYQISISGDWVRNGTFTQRNGTVYFTGAVPQSLNSGTTFYDLKIGGALNYNMTISEDIIVQNDLTISKTADQTRILADGTDRHTVHVAGDVLYSATTSMDPDLTVVFNGTGTQTFATISSGQLGSIRNSNTSAEVILGSNLVMGSGTIMFDVGTITDLGAYNVSRSSASAFTNNGTIKLTGDNIFTNVTPVNGSDSMIEYNANNGARTIKDWDYANLKINGGEIGLAGWWKFDEITAGTCVDGKDACDSSGNSNNGTWINSTPSPDTAPVRFHNHRALNFSGSGQYVNLGNLSLDVSAFTVSFHIKADSINTALHSGIIAKDNSFMVRFAQSTGNFQVYLGDGAAWLGGFISRAPLVTGQWYHVVITYDGVNLVLYLNGSAETVSVPTGVFGSNANDMLIGRWRANEDFDGRIDDLRFYNRVLTFPEITSLYEGFKNPGGTFVLTTGETLSGTLTVDAGIFDVGDQGLTVGGGSTNISGGVIKTGTAAVDLGNVAISDGAVALESDSDADLTFGTWLNSGGAVIYADAAVNSHALRSELSPYNDLIIAANDGAVYVLDGAITVREDFVINTGVVDTNNSANHGLSAERFLLRKGIFYARDSAINITSDFFTNDDIVRFNSNTSSVTFLSSGTIHVSPSSASWRSAFYDVQLAPPGEVTTLLSAFRVSNTITFNGGTVTGPQISITGTNPSPLIINGDTVMNISQIEMLENEAAITVSIPSYDDYPSLYLAPGSGASAVEFNLEEGGLTAQYFRIGRGTFNQNGQPVIVSSGISVSPGDGSAATWNSNGGTITINSSAVFHNGSDRHKTYNWDGSNVTIGGDVIIGNPNTTINAGNSTWHVAGGWNVSNGGIFNPGTSTVVFDAAAGSPGITSGSRPFHDLVFASTSARTYTLNDPLTVNGDLRIATDNTVDTRISYNNPITVGGNWTNEGTYTARYGTVNFSASDYDNTITSGGSSFYDITLGTGLWTPRDDVTVSNALVINGGTLYLNGKGLTATGADLNNDGTLRLNGDELLTDVLISTAQGAVEFVGSGVYPSLTTGNDYHDLIINGTGSWRPNANTNIDGIMRLDRGTLDLAANNPWVNVAGDFTIGVNGYWIKGNGLITFDGDLTYADHAGRSIGIVKIGSSPDTVTLATDMIADSLTIDTGDMLITDGFDLDINGNIDVNGTLDAGPGSDGTTTVFSAGSWEATGGNFINTNSLVLFNGTGTIASAGQSFNDIYVNTGLAGYWKLDETASPAIDSSGYGNNGIWKGAGLSASTSVPAVNFVDPRSIFNSGVNTHRIETEGTERYVMQKFSISFWTRRLGGQVVAAIDNDVSAVCGEGLRGGWYASYNNFSYCNSAQTQIQLSYNKDLGTKWTHTAVSFDSTGDVRIYRDGVLTNVQPAQGIFYNDPDPEMVISGQANSGNPFHGYIDEVRIYERVLSAAEIKLLAQGDQPGRAYAAAGEYVISGPLSAEGSMVIADGELDSDGNDINIGGSWSNYGGKYAHAGNIVTFDGTASDSVILAGGQTFNSLVIDGTGTWTLYDDLLAINIEIANGTLAHSEYMPLTIIGSDMAINGGAFMGVDSTLAVEGDLDIDGGTFTAPRKSLIIGGDLNKTGGIFDPNNGTVIFTTDHNVSFTPGGQSFNDLIMGDGLVAYWKLDETSEDTCPDGKDACDVSGNGYHLEWMNSPSASLDIPVPFRTDNDRSIALNGTDQYLRYTPGMFPAVPDDSRFTLTAWVKNKDNPANNSVVLGMTDASTVANWSYGMNISITSFVACFVGDGKGNRQGTGGETLENDRWHFVACSWDGSALRLYVDGQNTDTNPSVNLMNAPVSNNTQTFVIGTGYEGNNGHINGNIDDVRIYNRALSSAEINSLAMARPMGNVEGVVSLSGNLDADGDIVVASNTFNPATYNINAGGSWSNMSDGTFFGTFNYGTSSVTFDSSATAESVRANSQSFYNVTFNSPTGTWSLQTAMGVAGTFTAYSTGANGIMFNSSNVSVNNDFIIATNGTVNAGTSSITVAGDWDSSSGVFSRGASTVNLVGTGNLKAKFAYSAGSDFHDLNVAFPGQTTTRTGTNYFDINNVLTLNGGTLALGSDAGYLTMAGVNTTPLRSTDPGSVIDGGLIAYLNFASDRTYNVGADATLNCHLTLSSRTGQSNVVYALSRDTAISGFLKIENASTDTIFTTNGFDLFVGSKFYTGGYAYNNHSNPVTVNFSGSNININGDMGADDLFNTNVEDIINLGNARINIGGELRTFYTDGDHINTWIIDPGTSTVIFNGSNDQNIVTNEPVAFYDLTIDKPAGALRIPGNSIVNVNGNFNFESGNFAPGSNTIYAAGNWTIDPVTATFTAGASTIEFNGTQSQSVRSSSATYNDIIVSNSATVTFHDAFSAVSLTDIVAGSTLRFGGGEIYTITGALNVNGQSEETPIVLTSTDINRFVIANRTGGDMNVTYVSVSYSEVEDTSDGNIIAFGSIPGSQTDRTETAFPRWVFPDYSDSNAIFYGMHF
jgi:hypothetical protein